MASSDTTGRHAHAPGRMLHRAAALLTTKGEPVPAVADAIIATSPESVYEPLQRRRTDGGSRIGGSIRRTLSQVKGVGTTVARRASFKRPPPASPPTSASSLSMRTASSASDEPTAPLPTAPVSSTTSTFTLSPVSWAKRRKSHRRAQSEVLPTRPRVHHAHSPSAVAETASDSPSIDSLSVLPTPLSRMASLPESPSLEQPQQPESHLLQAEYHEVVSPVAQPSSGADATVPPILQQGIPMLKVSAKKQKRYVFKLDPDQGQIVWESKKFRFSEYGSLPFLPPTPAPHPCQPPLPLLLSPPPELSRSLTSLAPHAVPIENIKELRCGADARYYRAQFQLAQEYEDKWLTIVYILDGGYKTLHLIAATREIFQMWDTTLRRLYAIRQELMSGLGSADMRQALWEKQFWKGADEEQDQRLDFDDVERLCRRLNINPSREDLMRRFKVRPCASGAASRFFAVGPEKGVPMQQADTQNRGYLDFADFKLFVKSLKARPELDRLFLKITNGEPGLKFGPFEQFMRTSQKVVHLPRPIYG